MTAKQRNFLVSILSLSMTVALLSGCTGSKADGDIHLEKVSQELPVLKVAPVQMKQLQRQTELPGELRAYQDVPMYPKVEGFVKWISVDRGSRVKQGQTIIHIFAPELDAKCKEANAKVQGASSLLFQAQSRLRSSEANVKEGQAKESADTATYNRLKKASQTKGVVSENELDVASKQVEADQEHVTSLLDAVDAAKSDFQAAKDNVSAAKQAAEAVEDMRNYLDVKAPFDGMITRRNVHEGSYVSPADTQTPMVVCQQLSTLRLVIPVPEIAVSGVELGKEVAFTVPAYPNKKFYGKIARIGHALDQQTRTMPVELDVANANGELDPGMFPNVFWVNERPYNTMFVPASAVCTTMEKTFVVVIKDGKTLTVPVRTGQPMGNYIEVFGDLTPGDQVALHATDELRPGTQVAVKLASAADIDAKKEATAGE